MSVVSNLVAVMAMQEEGEEQFDQDAGLVRIGHKRTHPETSKDTSNLCRDYCWFRFTSDFGHRWEVYNLCMI